METTSTTYQCEYNGKIDKRGESGREIYYNSDIGGREPDLDETCQTAKHKQKNGAI